MSSGQHPEIAECEALTVVGDQVWAYAYSRYPVVRVENDILRSWLPPSPNGPFVVGATALATDGERVALVDGRWDRHGGRVVAVELDGDRWVPGRRTAVSLPAGVRLDPDAYVQGVGDVVHFFVGNGWYQIGLDDLAG